MVSSRGVNGIPARDLILEAYHLAAYQLIGGPAWLDSDRFAMEAKAGTAADDATLRRMLRTLLGQRFNLITHRETREMPVYILTISKSGTRLHELKPDEPSPPPPPEAFIVMRSPMDDFIAWFSNMGHVDRPILNKTGLNTGVYFFGLRWNGDEDIKVAVADSFGLKFETQKAPVDIVIIDRVEKPSAN